MTLKAAVLGNPIAQSKSPRMHNHWLSKLGIDGKYYAELVPLDGFYDTVQRLINEGFSGVNVTAPFKEEAYKIADDKSDLATQIGAANTLIFQNGKIIADNTDGYGFSQNILDQIPSWNTLGKHVILGAGGASRAIVAWLATSGAREIVIVNRSLDRAETLCNLGPQIRITSWENLSLELPDTTTLINTTSMGMNGQNNIEIDFSNAHKSLIVNDIVYSPLITKLLHDAKSVGFKTVGGLGMLLWQARPGFKAWFGVEPPLIDDELKGLMLK